MILKHIIMLNKFFIICLFFNVFFTENLSNNNQQLSSDKAETSNNQEQQPSSELTQPLSTDNVKYNKKISYNRKKYSLYSIFYIAFAIALYVLIKECRKDDNSNITSTFFVINALLAITLLLKNTINDIKKIKKYVFKKNLKFKSEIDIKS